MSKRKLNIGDIISYHGHDGEYIFVDLVVDYSLQENVYEVLDLLGNLGVYRILWEDAPLVEVT